MDKCGNCMRLSECTYEFGAKADDPSCAGFLEPLRSPHPEGPTMTDKTVLEVTQSAREAYLSLSMLPEFDAIDVREGRWDKTTGLQTFARFERDIRATRAPDPTPVAKVRVKHGGYGMELATYVAYGLPDGDHWLYAHPPAVPADGLVEMVARAIGTHIMPGSPWEASLRAELAAYRGEA